MGARAYHVEDPTDDEGRGIIVFAESRNQARRLGCETGELGYARYTDVRAVRALRFDGILQEEGLMRAQLEAGWWMECHGCYARVDVDRTPHRVVRGVRVFCTPACCIKTEYAERAGRARLWEALRRATCFWPTVRIERAFENVSGEWILSLYFPEKDQWVTCALPEGPIPADEGDPANG
jgi:hypothetical protein